MKKIVLISIYLSLFLGGYFLDKFLQSPGIMSQTMSGELVIAPTATTPENITIGNLGNVKLGNQDGWNIFVKDIALKYDPVTRNISGYYTLENFDEKGLDTVYIQSLLVIPRIQADYPPMYFDSRTTPPFTLPGKSELKREFTYNVREGLAGKSAHILFEVRMGGGDMITFIQSPPFDIPGELKSISIKKARIIDGDGQEYSIGAGPTIYPEAGNKFRLSYSLFNEGKNTLSVTPVMDVYELVDKDDNKILTVSGEVMKVAPGDSKILTFELPTANLAPDIYIGKFLLLDSNNVNLGLDVPVRWIIGGDIARIINVVNHHPYKRWGDVVVDLEYTGTPPSINETLQSQEPQTKDAEVLLTLQREDGTSLGEPYVSKVPIYLGQKIGSEQFTFPVGKYDKNPFLKVTIRSDKQLVLDEKVFSLSNSLKVQPEKDYTLYWIIFGILCGTGFLVFIIRKKKKRKIGLFNVVIFAGALLSIAYSPETDAYVADCEVSGINISGPSPSTTFVCGQTYAFTGGWWMNACMNTDADMYVDGAHVYHNDGLGCVSPGCEYNVSRSGSYTVYRAMPHNYRGGHNVNIGWSKSQGDCSNSGSEDYGLNVTCCAGPVPQNANKCPNTEANINNRPVLNCTGARACEYDCFGGYIPDSPASINCRLPRCLATSGVISTVSGGLNVIANAYFVSSPDNPAALQLTQDFPLSIQWSASGDSKATISRPDTGNGCEYTCNDGYIKAIDSGWASCRRARCLPGTGMNMATYDIPPANAYVFSGDELPGSGMLTMDYETTINWAASGDSKASITRPSSTKGCEYTCNDGYIKANDSGLISCRRARCLPNPNILVSTTDTAPPFASPLSGDELPGSGMLTMDYTTTLVDPITRPNSTKGCEYTCNNGYKMVTEGTITKCIPITCVIDVSKGQKAPTSTVCPTDADHANLSGHLDLPFTYVGYNGTTPNCTGPTKCEWFCPSVTPFYCSNTNTCLTRAADCCGVGETLCASTGRCATECTGCSTYAPSELKANIDQPYIKCDPTDQINTHFRYQIKQGSTIVYTSNAFTTGMEVKHPQTFSTPGSYTVTCLYGSASVANDNSKISALSPATTCAKTMLVKAENETVQGCSNIYGYRGNTLSNEMTSPNPFSGSFRCSSRVNTGTTDLPYKVKIGTSGTPPPQNLSNDAGFLTLFPDLGLGISIQSNPYRFTTINTPVECAVKVGDGYSTSSLCQSSVCVGSNCTKPQTFVITPSSESVCTTDLKSSYDIGCNPLDTTNYQGCVNWLYDGFKTCTIADQTACPVIKRTMSIKKNGLPDTGELTCKITKPVGAINFIKQCSILLPSGNIPVTIFGGDDDSYQTTRYSLQQDTVSPGAKLEYFVKSGTGTTLVTAEYWKNKPVTATITCNDLPGSSDGPECACAQTIDGDTDNLWSFGVPSMTGGPDLMTYNRTINSSNGPSAAVRVQDTAGLKSNDLIVNIAVDTSAPLVAPTMIGTTVRLVVSDMGGSRLWKPGKAGNTLPAGVVPNNAIIYRVGPLGDRAALQFIDNCIPDNNGNYYKYSETVSAQTSQTLDIPGVDASKILAYCVQDNAGNVTRGVYPSTPVACFSASNMTTVPKLSLTNNYIAPLIARITGANPQYGYGMSEDTTTANCFRGIISSNISRLVTSQYNSTLLTVSANNINWADPAKIKTNATISNTNGYYYYTTNNGTNNTTLTLPAAPTGRGTKTVVAEGANIHITGNINYLDEGDSTKILILIAKKNPTTGTGGNIYVDPSVTNIDAILIADGSLLNGSPSNALDWLNASEKNLINNRLTINGRLYSMNTRGGSLTAPTGGTTLSAITAGAGKYFNPSNSQLATPATINLAAEQDLERFRYINDDGAAQCTLHINYKTIPVNQLPEILVISGEYGGCNF